MSEPTTPVTRDVDMEDPVLKKIKSIRVGGENAFSSDTVKLFEGFPENLKHRANVSYVVEPQDMSLSWNIFKAAKMFGLEPLTAGMHFPMHMTLLEADCDECRWSEKGRMWREIEASFGRMLFGFSPVFSHVVVNSSADVLLMASHIPEYVLHIREKLKEIYERHGLKVRPMDDIMHISLQRLREYRNPVTSATPDALRNYRNMVIALDDHIARAVRVVGMHKGSARSLLCAPGFVPH